MLEIVLASSNRGKVQEFEELLKGLDIKLIPQYELNIPDAEETGTTFVENAIIKARHAAKYANLPAIADDSGLVIDALGGAPGVRSSRYAGANANDEARIVKVLSELTEVEDRDRTACFHCAIVLMENADDPAPLICQGMWEGTILKAPSGHRGFGYDPIFLVPTHGCSAAELDSQVKNRISHRGQAVIQLIDALTGSV